VSVNTGNRDRGSCPFETPRSIDQFQRELDLPRWSAGMADNPESRCRRTILEGSPKLTILNNVEKFGAKLEDAEFTISPVSNGRIFDQKKRRIGENRPAKMCRGPAVPKRPRLGRCLRPLIGMKKNELLFEPRPK